IPPVRETPKQREPDSNVPAPRRLDQSKQPRTFRAPLDPVARLTVPANTRPAVLPDPPPLRMEGGAAAPAPQHALTLSFSAPRPAALSPASGRLIWTGKLPKRSMLSLSAQGASLGYLNGWLPKAAVHVEVRPGELIEGGMVIFT